MIKSGKNQWVRSSNPLLNELAPSFSTSSYHATGKKVKMNGSKKSFARYWGRLTVECQYTFKEFSKDYKWNISRISTESQQNLSRISAESQQNLSRISAESQKNLSRISAESQQNLSRISAESQQTLRRSSAHSHHTLSRHSPWPNSQETISRHEKTLDLLFHEW